MSDDQQVFTMSMEEMINMKKTHDAPALYAQINEFATSQGQMLPSYEDFKSERFSHERVVVASFTIPLFDKDNQEILRATVWRSPYGPYYLRSFFLRGLILLNINNDTVDGIGEPFNKVKEQYDVENRPYKYLRFEYLGEILLLSAAYSMIYANGGLSDDKEAFKKMFDYVKSAHDAVINYKESVLMPENRPAFDDYREAENCDMCLKIFDDFEHILNLSRDNAATIFEPSNTETGELMGSILSSGLIHAWQSLGDVIEAYRKEDFTNEREYLFDDVMSDINATALAISHILSEAEENKGTEGI